MDIQPHCARYSDIIPLEGWWTLYICLCLKKDTQLNFILQTLRSGFKKKCSLSFLKELIVTMTWTIHPQFSSTPSPCLLLEACVSCSTILGKNFIKAMTLDPIRCQSGERSTHMFLWSLSFFSILIKTCRDSLCPRIWRINLTPWATQVVVGWGRIGCEDLRKEFGSRTSFCSVAKWSNIPLVPWTCPWNLYLEKTALILAGHKFYVYESWVFSILSSLSLSVPCFQNNPTFSPIHSSEEMLLQR